MNLGASLYLAARNLAIAEKKEVKDLLVPCNGCHLSFSEAMQYLRQDKPLREKIGLLLGDEELEYKGSIRIWHFIDLLHDKIRREIIKKSIRKPLHSFNLVSHYDCHIIRPSRLGRVDHPENPKKLDELIELLGAKSTSYPEKLDCCGAGLLLSHPETALTFAGLKIKAIQDQSANGLIDSCPSCHMMFDARQGGAGITIGSKLSLPVLYYTQLLGIAMGIEREKLGLHLNQSPVDALLEKTRG